MFLLVVLTDLTAEGKLEGDLVSVNDLNVHSILVVHLKRRGALGADEAGPDHDDILSVFTRLLDLLVVIGRAQGEDVLHVDAGDRWHPGVRARSNQQLVVNDLFAVARDKLLLVSLDFEAGILAMGVDIRVLKEVIVPQGEVLGIACCKSLRKESPVVGERLFFADHGDLTGEARLAEGFSTVQASRTSSNDNVMFLVVGVTLGQGHGDFTRQTILGDLNEELAIFLDNWERRDAVEAWSVLWLTSDDREASGVGRAQDLVIEKHSVVKRHTKVGTVVSRGVELALIASYEYFLVVTLANFEHLHLPLIEPLSKGNSDLSDARAGLSDLLLSLLLQIQSSGCGCQATDRQHRAKHEATAAAAVSIVPVR